MGILNQFNPQNYYAETFTARVLESSADLISLKILPTHKYDKSLTKDIVKIRKNSRDNSTEILVNRSSPARKELQKNLKTDDPRQTILQILDQATGHLRIDMTLDDRKWMTSIPEEFIETYHFNEFSNEQKAILAYYAPFSAYIQADFQLRQQVFQEVLSVLVLVTEVAPQYTEIDVGTLPQLDNWELEVNTVIGGSSKGALAALYFQIGPIPETEIEEWVPGGSKRYFFEKGLCPLLLEEERDWKIDIQIESSAQTWIIPDNSPDNQVGIIGMSTLLS